MNTIIKMREIPLHGKRVIIREDFNVPMHQGTITSDARLRAAVPTIAQACAAGARVLLLSHLGRPQEGVYDRAFSLSPVATALAKLLNKPVQFAPNWLDQPSEIAPGEVVLAENVRFNLGETSDDPELAKRMAALCDVFVMDAFGSAHRAHASTHGIAQFAPTACAGPLLEQELQALAAILEQPAHPLVAIVGGSKVSTKFAVLSALIAKVDQLIVGGGIANTFLLAQGHAVGKSLVERDFVPQALQLIAQAKQRGCAIIVPEDVVVAAACAADAVATIKPVAAVSAEDMILDIGSQSAQTITGVLHEARTILWNGPVGVFELAPFAQGTAALAQAIATSSAYSVAGGGDTLAAIEQYHIADKVSYISTGGGAFLEFIEGRKLPGIAVLAERKP